MADSLFSSELLDGLAAAPNPAGQVGLLEEAGLLTPTGLAALLEIIVQYLHHDPGRGRQLIPLFSHPTIQSLSPDLIPQANHLLAQSHAQNGQFEAALTWLQAARDGYTALGQEGQALRTNIGLMNILGELGRYQEAIQAGQMIIDRAAAGQMAGPPLLTALAHQNQGICYEHTGQYDQALAAYLQAEAQYQHLDMPEHVGHIRNNRGIVLLNLGHGREALEAFQTAATLFGPTDTLWLAQTQINIGNAYLLLGNYSQSLAVLGQARLLFVDLEAQAEENILQLDTATVYLALNLYPEAIIAYREVLPLLQSSGMVHHQARALWGLATALSQQGHLEEAEMVLAEAETLFISMGHGPFQAGVMLEQAALLLARGERGRAIQRSQQALAALEGHDWPVQKIYAYLRLADLLLPDVAKAEILLQEAYKISEPLALPHLRYRVWQRLGHVCHLQKRDEEAKKWLEGAVRDIEQLRGTLAQELVRASFLQDKTTAYEDLLQLYLEEGDVEGAFGLAEAARSRALLDLLMGVVSSKATLADDPTLMGKIERLQADLNAIYNQALTDDVGRRPYLGELQGRALALENEVNRLRLLLPAGTTGDLFAQPLSLAAIQDSLPADLILLTYYTIGDEILAFVQQKGQLTVHRHLAQGVTVQALLQRLTMQWDHFRGGPLFVSRNMKLLEQSVQRLLAALYGVLIGPLADTLPAGGGKMVIVPHGLLHQVPFQALYDQGHYLLERFEISYAPSATVLALCQARQPRHTGRGLVMGIADESIPAVANEIAAVSRYLPDSKSYFNEQATIQAIQTQAAACDTLHLACHGLFRGDNPMFSALRLQDGWLTAADALQLNLQGAQVTLSACESGRGRVLAGDEVLGLARAFLGAGASTLIVSLWLVEDESTADFMAHYYGQLAEQGPAAALRSAQLFLKARYAHPYYWAPFVLLGKATKSEQ